MKGEEERIHTPSKRTFFLGIALPLVAVFFLGAMGVGLIASSMDSPITGIWQKCGGGGYLVLLGDPQQVNVVGDEVEVGGYSFDGSRLEITTHFYYPGYGSVVQQVRKETLDYDPRTAALTDAGMGQCFARVEQ